MDEDDIAAFDDFEYDGGDNSNETRVENGKLTFYKETNF